MVRCSSLYKKTAIRLDSGLRHLTGIMARPDNQSYLHAAYSKRHNKSTLFYKRVLHGVFDPECDLFWLSWLILPSKFYFLFEYFISYGVIISGNTCSVNLLLVDIESESVLKV